MSTIRVVDWYDKPHAAPGLVSYRARREDLEIWDGRAYVRA